MKSDLVIVGALAGFLLRWNCWAKAAKDGHHRKGPPIGRRCPKGTTGRCQLQALLPYHHRVCWRALRRQAVREVGGQLPELIVSMLKSLLIIPMPST